MNADLKTFLVAACLVAASWKLLDSRGSLGPPPSGLAPMPCESGSAWRHSSGALTDLSAERVFRTNTALLSCAGTAGVLSARLRGSQVDGVGAQVVIALGTANLWEGFVTDPIELNIDVPHAGTMVIAFVNDRHEPPMDRDLWISDVVFTQR